MPGSMVAGRTKRPSIAPPRIRAGTDTTIKQELKECKRILKEIMSHRSAWPFNQPVDITKFYNYYQVIERPMDLGTMKKRLDSGQYADLDAFAADMKTIWNNCYTFNPDPQADVRTTPRRVEGGTARACGRRSRALCPRARVAADSTCARKHRTCPQRLGHPSLPPVPALDSPSAGVHHGQGARGAR